jgi:hypothetical protein
LSVGDVSGIWNPIEGNPPPPPPEPPQVVDTDVFVYNVFDSGYAVVDSDI